MSRQFLLDRLLGLDVEGDGGEGDVYLDKVPSWGVKEVSNWVVEKGFGDYAEVFEKCGVDGDILLLLTEKDVKEDLGMVNGILRKRFLRELRNLRKTADYSECEGGKEISLFLSRINSDFREFTYNLVSKDMNLCFMKALSPLDLQEMLKEAGVENLVQRHKLVEAIIGMGCEDDILSDSGMSETNYDVYLTHPQGKGAELASLIKMQLELRGISVYISSPLGGSPATAPLSLIRDTKHFVLVLSPGGLDSRQDNTRLYSELKTALSVESNIIPVTDNFQWPDLSELPEEIRGLAYFNSVRWVHDYQTACILKLERFIKGEVMVRVDSPCGSFGTGYGSPARLPHSRRVSGVSSPMLGSRRSSGLSLLSQNLSASLLSVPRQHYRSTNSLNGLDGSSC